MNRDLVGEKPCEKAIFEKNRVWNGQSQWGLVLFLESVSNRTAMRVRTDIPKQSKIIPFRRNSPTKKFALLGLLRARSFLTERRRIRTRQLNVRIAKLSLVVVLLWRSKARLLQLLLPLPKLQLLSHNFLP